MYTCIIYIVNMNSMVCMHSIRNGCDDTPSHVQSYFQLYARFEIHKCCILIFSLTFSLALHSLAYEEVHALALDQVLAPERESHEEVMWSGICLRMKRTVLSPA